MDCLEPDAWFTLDPGDPEIAAHLDRCTECRGVAAMIARVGLLEAAPGEDTGLVPELLPSGAQLGRYVVRGAIGAGGMGVVLEAYDPKLDRRVALKVVRRLRDDAGWERAKARVLAEAQAMARLAHPNVIAIHDLVEIGAEQLIAMEHVDGPDLDAWLESAPSLRERMRVIVEAARGLAAAHDAGVVHRDVKPSNILVGADGRARVTDFGLATLAGDVAPGAIGTPGFLAPEVAEGGAVDERADQYAFAVTAWRAVFDAEPGERGTGPIARTLSRGLARDPAARWPSMHALADALERRSHRRWWIAGGAVAIAAIALVLWLRHDNQSACVVDDSVVWSAKDRAAWIESLRRTTGAVAETLAADIDRAWQTWREASTEACGAPVSVTDCLASTQRQLTAFIKLAPTSALKAQDALSSITSAKLCLKPPGQRPIAQSPELRAARAPFKAALDEVSTMSALGDYDNALKKLDELLAKVPPNDPALRGELLYRKADQLSRTGDTQASVPVLEEGLAIAERAGNDVARLNTMIMLLSAYEELGKLDEAKALAKIAEAALDRVPRDPYAVGRLETALGAISYDTGDFAEAERHYRANLAIQEELNGASSEVVAGALHNLGLAVHLGGRLDEAKQIQERSLAMFEATVGPKHPDTALPVTELAGLALERDQLDEAVKLYRRGLAIREDALGHDHPALSETLTGLGRAEAQLGHIDEAIAAFRRGRTVGIGFGEQHPLVAQCEYHLASLLDHKGERVEALSLLEHAAASWDANGVALPEAGYTRFLLAQYRWRSGDHDAARTLAKRAHESLAALAAPYQKDAHEVEAWLAKH